MWQHEQPLPATDYSGQAWYVFRMLFSSDSEFCSSLLQVQTAEKLGANYPHLIPRTVVLAALTALGYE